MSVLRARGRHDRDVAQHDAATAIRFARDEIRTGRFQRSMSLVVAFAAIVSGFESYTQHTRGDFSSRWMWTPVWLMPVAAAAGGAAVVSRRAAKAVLPGVAVASLADGIIGFGLHLRGIARMPGGYRAGQYNVTMGPPVFAPLLMASVGVLGLVAAGLRQEDIEELVAEEHGGRRAMTAGLAASIGTAIEALSRDDEDASVWLEDLGRAVGHGEFQKLMALTAASFAMLAGGEAYFEHLRGSFNDRWMWTPVWLTPPMVGAAVAAVADPDAASTLLPAASAVTFVDGLIGFGLHLRAAFRMPGGIRNFRFNVTYGPPLFAPLLLTSVGLTGLVASLLRRRP